MIVNVTIIILIHVSPAEGNHEEVTVKEMLATKALRVRHMAEEKLITPKSSSVSYAVNLPKLRSKFVQILKFN